MFYKYTIGFKTLLVKEVRRFMGFWPETLLLPIITNSLFFIIFGNLMGQRIGAMNGVSYINFIAPGLIMMSVITSSYANVAFSFFTSKFFRSIEDILIAPIPNWLILSSYIIGGIVRGLVVAAAVLATSLFFTRLMVHHLWLMFTAVILTSALFSLAGFLNGVYAKKFDDMGIVPTFILTPLTYLGGVFFSVHMLPPIWKTIALFNPILYCINLFRYSMLGVSDVNVGWTIVGLSALVAVLFIYALSLFNRGVGIKT